MNHWLILLLTIVAMVAIVLAFMWWWTTDNWDWADTTLKPPRTVPQEPLRAYLDWVDWREMAGKWMELQENINPQVAQSFRELEQRVRALEERLMSVAQASLEGRTQLLDWAELHQEKHRQAATPSPPTASPTTGSPSDAVQETTGVWTPQSWQLDPRITPGGPVGFGSEFVDPEDVLT